LDHLLPLLSLFLSLYPPLPILSAPFPRHCTTAPTSTTTPLSHLWRDPEREIGKTEQKEGRGVWAPNFCLFPHHTVHHQQQWSRLATALLMNEGKTAALGTQGEIMNEIGKVRSRIEAGVLKTGVVYGLFRNFKPTPSTIYPRPFTDTVFLRHERSLSVTHTGTLNHQTSHS